MRQTGVQASDAWSTNCKRFDKTDFTEYLSRTDSAAPGRPFGNRSRHGTVWPKPHSIAESRHRTPEETVRWSRGSGRLAHAAAGGPTRRPRVPGPARASDPRWLPEARPQLPPTRIPADRLPRFREVCWLGGTLRPTDPYPETADSTLRIRGDSEGVPIALCNASISCR